MNKQQKPLTAEEMYNETSLFGTRDETIELMERFAAQQVAAALADKKEPEPTDINNLYYQWYKNSECVGPSLLDAFKAGHEQQTAALREDFRQMMERRDHWKKESETLREEGERWKERTDFYRDASDKKDVLIEELEIIKARNEGLEQEKQEYIDKYNLAISELEAVKKERDEATENYKVAFANRIELRSDLSKAERQRDEAVKLLGKANDLIEGDEANVLLKQYVNFYAYGTAPEFEKRVNIHLSRLSSRETKRANNCWENNQPQPCTGQEIKSGQCGCNPTPPEYLTDKTSEP